MKAQWVESKSVVRTDTLFEGVLGSYTKVRRKLVVDGRVERIEGYRTETVADKR